MGRLRVFRCGGPGSCGQTFPSRACRTDHDCPGPLPPLPLSCPCPAMEVAPMPPSLPSYATLTCSSTSTCPSLPETLHMDSGDFFPTHQAAPAPPSFPLSSVWQGSKRSREEQEEVHKSREEQKEVHKSREEQEEQEEALEEVHKSSEEQEEQEEALSLSQAESSTSPVRQIKNTNSDGHTSPPKKQVSSRNALFGLPGAGEEELELAARKQELELVAGTQEELSMALGLSKEVAPMPPSLPSYATLTYSSTSTCPSLPETLHMDSGDLFPTPQDHLFLAREVSAWQESEPDGNLDLTNISQDEWGRARLYLTICSAHIVLQCPAGYPNYQAGEDSFFLEASSANMISWLTAVNEFAVDSCIQLSLANILSKCRRMLTSTDITNVSSSEQGSVRSETLSPTSNQPSSPDQPQDDDDFGLMDFLGCKAGYELNSTRTLPGIGDASSGEEDFEPFDWGQPTAGAIGRGVGGRGRGTADRGSTVGASGGRGRGVTGSRGRSVTGSRGRGVTGSRGQVVTGSRGRGVTGNGGVHLQLSESENSPCKGATFESRVSAGVKMKSRKITENRPFRKENKKGPNKKLEEERLEHNRRMSVNVKKIQNRWICKNCNYASIFKMKLKHHTCKKFKVGMAHKVKKYNCGHCEETFKCKNGRNNHRAQVHSKGTKCAQCSKHFQFHRNFQRHMKEVHQKALPFKCNICGIEFNAKRYLVRHKAEFCRKKTVYTSASTSETGPENVLPMSEHGEEILKHIKEDLYLVTHKRRLVQVIEVKKKNQRPGLKPVSTSFFCPFKIKSIVMNKESPEFVAMCGDACVQIVSINENQKKFIKMGKIDVMKAKAVWLSRSSLLIVFTNRDIKVFDVTSNSRQPDHHFVLESEDNILDVSSHSSNQGTHVLALSSQGEIFTGIVDASSFQMPGVVLVKSLPGLPLAQAPGGRSSLHWSQDTELLYVGSNTGFLEILQLQDMELGITGSSSTQFPATCGVTVSAISQSPSCLVKIEYKNDVSSHCSLARVREGSLDSLLMFDKSDIEDISLKCDESDDVKIIVKKAGDIGSVMTKYNKYNPSSYRSLSKVCLECGHITRDKNNLLLHSQRHNQQNLVCPICNIVKKDSYYLSIHMPLCFKSCPKNGCMFKAKSDGKVSSHIRAAHRYD